MMVTYPGYVFVRRPLLKIISWIAMSEWEYIEHAQITDNGKYGFCLASKTMDHKVENAIIAVKFDKRVDARVILTPGYAKEDSILYIERHNLAFAVCHDENDNEWRLVCFDLEETFNDSCQVIDVCIDMFSLQTQMTCTFRATNKHRPRPNCRLHSCM